MYINYINCNLSASFDFGESLASPENQDRPSSALSLSDGRTGRLKSLLGSTNNVISHLQIEEFNTVQSASQPIKKHILFTKSAKSVHAERCDIFYR